MGALPSAPVCVKCRCLFYPKKNGFYFLEGMPKDNHEGFTADEIRGNRMPEQWEPYKLWVSDLWKCKDCGHEILKGTNSNRLAEHYEPHFKEWIEKLGAKLIVNDC